jgi:hypothetical protein
LLSGEVDGVVVDDRGGRRGPEVLQRREDVVNSAFEEADL